MPQPAQGALRGEPARPSTGGQSSPHSFYSHERFQPLMSTTPAVPTRDASRTKPPRAPQRSSMVAPGAKSEESEPDDCDNVSRRLYNLRFPIVEEKSDDASEAYEPHASLSGMSRDTRDMWDNYDESRT